MAENKIVVTIETQDLATEQVEVFTDILTKLHDELERGTQSAKDHSAAQQGIVGTTRGLATRMKGVVSGVLGAANAFGAIKAAAIVGEMTAVGNEARVTRERFEALAGEIGNVDEIMRNLRSRTGNTVDDTTLQDNAFQLIATGAADTQEELEQLIGMIVRLKDPSIEAGQAIKDFTAIVTDQSTTKLDDFGLSSERVVKRMEELKVAGENAQDAFTMATLEEGKRRIEELGDAAEASFTATEQLKTRWDNFWSGVSETVAGAVEGIAGGIEDIFGSLDGLSDQERNQQFMDSLGLSEEAQQQFFAGIQDQIDLTKSKVIELINTERELAELVFRPFENTPGQFTDERVPGSVAMDLATVFPEAFVSLLYTDPDPNAQYRSNYLTSGSVTLGQVQELVNIAYGEVNPSGLQLFDYRIPLFNRGLYSEDELAQVEAFFIELGTQLVESELEQLQKYRESFYTNTLLEQQQRRRNVANQQAIPGELISPEERFRREVQAQLARERRWAALQQQYVEQFNQGYIRRSAPPYEDFVAGIDPTFADNMTPFQTRQLYEDRFGLRVAFDYEGAITNSVAPMLEQFQSMTGNIFSSIGEVGTVVRGGTQSQYNDAMNKWRDIVVSGAELFGTVNDQLSGVSDGVINAMEVARQAAIEWENNLSIVLGLESGGAQGQFFDRLASGFEDSSLAQSFRIEGEYLTGQRNELTRLIDNVWAPALEEMAATMGEATTAQRGFDIYQITELGQTMGLSPEEINAYVQRYLSEGGGGYLGGGLPGIKLGAVGIGFGAGQVVRGGEAGGFDYTKGDMSFFGGSGSLLDVETPQNGIEAILEDMSMLHTEVDVATAKSGAIFDPMLEDIDTAGIKLTSAFEKGFSASVTFNIEPHINSESPFLRAIVKDILASEMGTFILDNGGEVPGRDPRLGGNTISPGGD